ncbi:hypothetical protein QAD02_001724 [Eretmocerus hayati]|uniref:Uncharacterized protein n=1 Tax=Eretmocerus hayati TaxID=131215 RepID=A0ACC2NGY0_9HYME|nr:hypothetical protein QAD02_001724 [Eretmocerus hayati]
MSLGFGKIDTGGDSMEHVEDNFRHGQGWTCGELEAFGEQERLTGVALTERQQFGSRETRGWATAASYIEGTTENSCSLLKYWKTPSNRLKQGHCFMLSVTNSGLFSLIF